MASLTPVKIEIETVVIKPTNFSPAFWLAFVGSITTGVILGNLGTLLALKFLFSAWLYFHKLGV